MGAVRLSARGVECVSCRRQRARSRRDGHGQDARRVGRAERRVARGTDYRPALRTWGLSATIGNLDVAMEALLGVGQNAPRRIVRGVDPKRVIIDALLPPVVERFPWAGHLGTQMLPQVIDAIEEGESAIV